MSSSSLGHFSYIVLVTFGSKMTNMLWLQPILSIIWCDLKITKLVKKTSLKTHICSNGPKSSCSKNV
jgi:hypothetical protein